MPWHEDAPVFVPLMRGWNAFAYCVNGVADKKRPRRERDGGRRRRRQKIRLKKRMQSECAGSWHSSSLGCLYQRAGRGQGLMSFSRSGALSLGYHHTIIPPPPQSGREQGPNSSSGWLEVNLECVKTCTRSQNRGNDLSQAEQQNIHQHGRV